MGEPELNIENKTLGGETFNIHLSYFACEKRNQWDCHLLIKLFKDGKYKEYDTNIYSPINRNDINDIVEYFKQEPFGYNDAQAESLKFNQEEINFLIETINDFERTKRPNISAHDAYYGM